MKKKNSGETNESKFEHIKKLVDDLNADKSGEDSYEIVLTKKKIRRCRGCKERESNKLEVKPYYGNDDGTSAMKFFCLPCFLENEQVRSEAHAR